MRPTLSVLASLALAFVVGTTASSCGSTFVCDETTCADGCCDWKGVCQVGNVDRACGLQGATCANCMDVSFRQVCSAAGTCCGGEYADCTTNADCCGGLTCQALTSTTRWCQK